MLALKEPVCLLKKFSLEKVCLVVLNSLKPYLKDFHRINHQIQNQKQGENHVLKDHLSKFLKFPKQINPNLEDQSLIQCQ